MEFKPRYRIFYLLKDNFAVFSTAFFLVLYSIDNQGVSYRIAAAIEFISAILVSSLAIRGTLFLSLEINPDVKITMFLARPIIIPYKATFIFDDDESVFIRGYKIDSAGIKNMDELVNMLNKAKDSGIIGFEKEAPNARKKLEAAVWIFVGLIPIGLYISSFFLPRHFINAKSDGFLFATAFICFMYIVKWIITGIRLKREGT